jgi:hypothetical protein
MTLPVASMYSSCCPTFGPPLTEVSSRSVLLPSRNKIVQSYCIPLSVHVCQTAYKAIRLDELPPMFFFVCLPIVVRTTLSHNSSFSYTNIEPIKSEPMHQYHIPSNKHQGTFIL